MPSQASNAAIFRTGNYWAKAYLSVYCPDPVAEFTLTATPASGATVLGVSYTVGSESDTRQGFYLRFYDGTTGDFKGDSRIRNSAPRTSSSLPVRELPYGHAKLASGDVGKVYVYVPLDTKLVDASAQFNPDGESYADEGLNPPPVVNFGSHWAGWSDAALGYALITAKGSASFLVDPTSSTPVTHFTVRHPTTGLGYHSGSSNTSADPVFEAAPGTYAVEHIGTDPDNSRTGSNFVAYMAHDPDTNPPIHVYLPTPPVGDPLNGWSWTFEPEERLDFETAWDGCLVILWSDDYHNQALASYRSSLTGRSHILGIGYLRRDTSTGNATDGDRVTFEVQSPLARLGEIASYSKVMQEATTPDSWAGVNTLTIKRALIGIRQNYTFMQEAGFDFLVHSLYSDANYPAFYIQRSDAISQMREAAGGRRSLITNPERGGQFLLMPHLAFLSMAQRASVTTTFTLTDDDVFTYSYTREHQDSLELFELQGITAGASGNQPVYSRSPGLSPGGGKNYVTEGKYIPDGQTSQNADAAMKMAFAQQIFIDSDNRNRKQRVGELTLQLPGQYAFWDWNCEYTYFAYAGSRRGIDFTGLRFWLKRFQTGVDAETGEWTSEAVFQAETGAPEDAAQTYVPTDESFVAPPIFYPPNPPTSLPLNAGLLGRGLAELVFFNADGGLYYAANANRSAGAGGATFSRDLDLSTDLSVSGTLNDATVNAFSSKYAGSGSSVDGWIVTAAEVRKLSDAGGAPSVSSAVSLSPAPTAPVTMDFERSVPNWGILAYYSKTNGTYIAYTTNGTSWSIVQITAFYDTSANQFTPGLYLNPHSAGTAYVTAYTSTSGTPGTALYRTTDYGASWTLISNPAVAPGTGLAVCLVVAYPNGGDTVFYAHSAGGAVAFMGVIGSGTPVNLSPVSGGQDYAPVFTNRALSISPTNANVAVLCGWNAYDGSEAGGVWRTTNLLTALQAGVRPTWVEVVAPTASFGIWWRAYVSGNDPGYCYLLGKAGNFGVLINNTFEDRSGNMAVDYPSAGAMLSLWGL